MNTPEFDAAVRRQLLCALKGGQAFDTFEEIVQQVPPNKRFQPASREGRSAWQILEHMHMSITDLCDFIDNSDGSYKEKNWPEDYWPKRFGPGEGESWEHSIQLCHKANERLSQLISDPSRDLLQLFPWGDGQNLLHEALLAIQHASYHLGELVELTVALSE